jgi:hypothetical protein
VVVAVGATEDKEAGVPVYSSYGTLVLSESQLVGVHGRDRRGLSLVHSSYDPRRQASRSRSTFLAEAGVNEGPSLPFLRGPDAELVEPQSVNFPVRGQRERGPQSTLPAGPRR